MQPSKRAAFAAAGNRIAPVFDVAVEILVVDGGASGMFRALHGTTDPNLLVPRALRLVELSVRTLVCGAISRELLALIRAYGISVHPFVTGDLYEVVEIWKRGGLDAPLLPVAGVAAGATVSGAREPRAIALDGGGQGPAPVRAARSIKRGARRP